MTGANFAAQDLSFARIAEQTFKFRLVLMRLPGQGESQTDDRGFPIDTSTVLQGSGESIPCMYVTKSVRETIQDDKVKSATIFNFTIPKLYRKSNGQFTAVVFSDQYRVKLLATDTNDEKTLEIISGDKDPGPAIIFDAVEFETTP